MLWISVCIVVLVWLLFLVKSRWKVKRSEVEVKLQERFNFLFRRVRRNNCAYPAKEFFRFVLSEINKTNKPSQLTEMLFFVRGKFFYFSPELTLELERYLVSKLERRLDHGYFSSFQILKKLYLLNPKGRNGDIRFALYQRMVLLPLTFFQRAWVSRQALFSIYASVLPRLVYANEDDRELGRKIMSNALFSMVHVSFLLKDQD